MKQMMRVTVERDRVRRSFVCIQSPFPNVGETITMNGEDWLTVKTEETIGIEVKFPKKKKMAVKALASPM